ncbi:MAG: dephospho-CoA kinase [Cephaloticoccus sp.]
MVIGITGGMGCGKSQAAGMVAALGFTLLDSDAMIRERVLRAPGVVAAIAERFGSEMLAADGQVDRAALAGLVFPSDEERLWLEQLTHPRLFAAWREEMRTRPERAWVIEVPLLFEKGLENWFDFTVCVACSPVQQLARLEQRGIPRTLAEQRISKQLPLATKTELSDIVLWNDGSIEFLQSQVKLMIDGILRGHAA